MAGRIFNKAAAQSISDPAADSEGDYKRYRRGDPLTIRYGVEARILTLQCSE
jgi:hypothetical protein